MNKAVSEFCASLAHRFSNVGAILREHIIDNDELLPHLFLADVTRHVLADREDRILIIQFIEESFTADDPELEELIAVSFVEYLVNQEEFDRATKGTVVPRILAEWHRQQMT